MLGSQEAARGGRAGKGCPGCGGHHQGALSPCVTTGGESDPSAGQGQAWEPISSHSLATVYVLCPAEF